MICSDTGWMAEDYEKDPQPAGKSKYFTRPEQNPTVWEYSEKVYEPVCVTEYNGGTLYEFETELNAVLEAEFKKRISAGMDLLRRIQGRGNRYGKLLL